MPEVGNIRVATPPANGDNQHTGGLGGELQPPRRRHRQARQLTDDGANASTSKTFLETVENALLVATFYRDDAVVRQARLHDLRHEQNTLPVVRAAIPAVNRAAAAPSSAPLPPPATS